jgi:hypothetical protein
LMAQPLLDKLDFASILSHPLYPPHTRDLPPEVAPVYRTFRQGDSPLKKRSGKRKQLRLNEGVKAHGSITDEKKMEGQRRGSKPVVIARAVRFAKKRLRCEPTPYQAELPWDKTKRILDIL